jgi:hypothetical protein
VIQGKSVLNAACPAGKSSGVATGSEASAVSAAVVVGSIPVNVPWAIEVHVASLEVGVSVPYAAIAVSSARLSGESPPHPVRVSRPASTRSVMATKKDVFTLL